MSDPGDYASEMERFQKLSDRDVETLLAGRAPTGDGDLTELAALIGNVKVSAVRPLDTAVEQRHLSAIVEAARLAPHGSPTGAPALRSTRRKSMLALLLAPLWAKIATAAAVALVATGGLATADQLPQPAQDAIAKAAEVVGINLPSSEDTEAAVEEGSESEEGEGSESKRVDGDVRTVLEDESLEGRDKGEAVADAADKNRQDGSTPASRNPTGFGPDNHPTGPVESGEGEVEEEEEATSNNPTGYGPGNHPTGNPTGYGPPR